MKVMLTRGNSIESKIDLSGVPDPIKDSFAKVKLKNIIAKELNPLVDFFKINTVILDVINISDKISESVNINKFIGLDYSSNLVYALGAMIYSEIERTCNYLKMKYGDNIFYDNYLDTMRESRCNNIASSVLSLICK